MNNKAFQGKKWQREERMANRNTANEFADKKTMQRSLIRAMCPYALASNEISKSERRAV